MSNNKSSYNKLSDEQVQASYDYPKISESALKKVDVSGSENDQNNKKIQNQLPQPPINQMNQPNFIAHIPSNPPPLQYNENYNIYPVQNRPQPPPPPPQYVIYNQQPIIYPVPVNVNIQQSQPQAQPQIFHAPEHHSNERSYEELEIGNREPVEIICPSCNGRIQTIVKHKVGLGTNFTAMVLCFLGGGCFLCVVPYLLNTCQDAVHFCPLCDARIGTSAFLC